MKNKKPTVRPRIKAAGALNHPMVRIQVRVPRPLQAELQSQATANGRTLSNQCLSLLQGIVAFKLKRGPYAKKTRTKKRA